MAEEDVVRSKIGRLDGISHLDLDGDGVGLSSSTARVLSMRGLPPELRCRQLGGGAAPAVLDHIRDRFGGEERQCCVVWFHEEGGGNLVALTFGVSTGKWLAGG